MATGLGLACSLAALLLVVATSGAAVERTDAQQRAAPISTCFWEGPISMKRRATNGFDGHYFNYPEESATYWLARFEVPAGAKLYLRGRYAHARYHSLNSYSEGAPTDALSDFEIRPLPGSTNPFLVGNRRDLPNRSYRVVVLDRPSPPAGERRKPNTLYAQPEGEAPIELLYRTYEPDRGRDLTGGVGLPRPILTLADGARRRGAALCRAINDPDREIPVLTTPEEQWFVAEHAPGCDPDTAPAVDPPHWKRFFNLNYARVGFALGCSDAAQATHEAMPPGRDGGAFYSNQDIRYLYTSLSRGFGPVLVIRARMPTHPSTYRHQRRMGTGQVRFWSLCATESPLTVRTEDCLADRQVPLGPRRRYTIVVSKPPDRPDNARRACGVAWLRWPLRGDGDDSPDYANLIIRNMLAASGFEHAIQNIRDPGTEEEVMGPYFPRSTYTSTAAFEARGCGD